MKRTILSLAVLFIAAQTAFSLTLSEMRSVTEKSQATVADGYLMLSSLKNPEISNEQLNWKLTARIAALKPESPLTAGSFSKMAIEMGLAKGGLIYAVTGFEKYAAESLQFNKLLPGHYSWNRTLSGKELLGLLSGLSK